MKYLLLALEWVPVIWLGVTAFVILHVAIFGGSFQITLGRDK